LGLALALPDWQFISIIVSIVGSAVGATAWITWKMSKAETEINNLKDKVKKAEDDITYMFRLDLEESHKVAEKFRTELGFKKTTKNKTSAAENKDDDD
jgi:uncharacterized protein (DUF697 family)